MTNPTPHGQVPAIQRYKIGYHSGEWGVRSLSPTGIYDDAGPWVRYKDHIAALHRLHAENEALRTQQQECGNTPYDEGPFALAQPVAQRGAADGFFLLLPQRPKPEAPAGTAGLDWDAYSGAQMLAFGRDCSDAAIAALRTQQTAPAGFVPVAAFDRLYAHAESLAAQLLATPQQEVQEPYGWLYDWTHSSATGKPDTTYTGFTKDEAHARKHDNCIAVFTTQQPAPATQQAGDVVAYLDVGASGYLDLGAALSEDALQQLPKGRHALIIAGTYGIDGYVAAPQPSPTTKPAPQPAPAPLSDEAKDAMRWRETLMHIGAANHLGGQHFTLNTLRISDQMFLLRGSTSQHFTKCIDESIARRAALAAQKGK